MVDKTIQERIKELDSSDDDGKEQPENKHVESPKEEETESFKTQKDYDNMSDKEQENYGI